MLTDLAPPSYVTTSRVRLAELAGLSYRVLGEWLDTMSWTPYALRGVGSGNVARLATHDYDATVRALRVCQAARQCGADRRLLDRIGWLPFTYPAGTLVCLHRDHDGCLVADVLADPADITAHARAVGRSCWYVTL